LEPSIATAPLVVVEFLMGCAAILQDNQVLLDHLQGLILTSKGLLTVLFCRHVEKSALEGSEKAFLVDMNDAPAFQVPHALRILSLQRGEVYHD
jgi:hypothetical protein